MAIFVLKCRQLKSRLAREPGLAAAFSEKNIPEFLGPYIDDELTPD